MNRRKTFAMTLAMVASINTFMFADSGVSCKGDKIIVTGKCKPDSSQHNITTCQGDQKISYPILTCGQVLAATVSLKGKSVTVKATCGNESNYQENGINTNGTVRGTPECKYESRGAPCAWAQVIANAASPNPPGCQKKKKTLPTEENL